MNLLAAWALLAGSAGAVATQGEGWVWVSSNQYAMAGLVDGLATRFGWPSGHAHAMLHEGWGFGAEVNGRLGRRLGTGLGVAGEALLASGMHDLGLQTSVHGTTTLLAEEVDVSAWKVVARYSGSVDLSERLALHWGAGIGAGGLLAKNNYAVTDEMGTPSATAEWKVRRGRVVEVDGGPVLRASGPGGWRIAFRFGWRSFVAGGPDVSANLTYPVPGRFSYAGMAPDWSGVFWRICLGGGR